MAVKPRASPRTFVSVGVTNPSVFSSAQPCSWWVQKRLQGKTGRLRNGCAAVGGRGHVISGSWWSRSGAAGSPSAEGGAAVSTVGSDLAGHGVSWGTVPCSPSSP